VKLVSSDTRSAFEQVATKDNTNVQNKESADKVQENAILGSDRVGENDNFVGPVDDMSNPVPKDFKSVTGLAADKPPVEAPVAGETKPPPEPKPEMKLRRGSPAGGKMDSAPSKDDAGNRVDETLEQLSHIEEQFQVITEKRVLDDKYAKAIAMCEVLPVRGGTYEDATADLKRIYKVAEARIRTTKKKRPVTDVNYRLADAIAKDKPKKARKRKAKGSPAPQPPRAPQGGFQSAPMPPGQ
jgi:hypothetical protein